MGGVQAWEAAAYRGPRRPPAGGPGGRRKKTCIKKLAKIKMRRQKAASHVGIEPKTTGMMPCTLTTALHVHRCWRCETKYQFTIVITRMVK